MNTIVLLGGPKHGTVYPVEDAPDSLLGYRKVRTIGSQPKNQTYLYLHESVATTGPVVYRVTVAMVLEYRPATDQVSVHVAGGKSSVSS